MKVGAVIRALNEEQHIGRLLTGLEQQSRRLDTIVLVDSGSTDATVAIAEHYGVKVVHIAPEEFTFGRSLNIGVEACDADLVMLLSAHVYPRANGLVRNMIAPFEDESVAVAYGRQVGDHRTAYSELRVMRRWYPARGSGVQEDPFCNNANATVRKDVWEKLRYDEELTGLEDLEFATRAQAEGWQVAYVAEAPVVHVHEESWQTVRNRYRREAVAYARINQGWRMSLPEALALGVTNAVADVVHATVEGKIRDNLLSIPAFRAAQFLGAWEGARTRGHATEALRQRFYYPSGISRREPVDPKLGEPITYGGPESE